MATVAEVRAAIKTVLEAAISGLSVHQKMVGIANVPAVVVQPVDTDYDQAMARGMDTWAYDLIVLASKADETTAQERLDEMVDGGGAKSVRKAIFDNKTLGLTNTDAHVARMSGYNGQHSVGAFTYVGATLRLVVHTKPS